MRSLFCKSVGHTTGCRVDLPSLIPQVSVPVTHPSGIGARRESWVHRWPSLGTDGEEEAGDYLDGLGTEGRLGTLRIRPSNLGLTSGSSCSNVGPRRGKGR